MSFDLILSDGEVIDGDGGPARRIDVGISEGHIEAMGDLSDAPTSRRQRLEGLVVTPGFIDTHTHTDVAPFMDKEQDTLRLGNVRQGVTTEIAGNCGYTAYPATPANQEAVDRHVRAAFGDWARTYPDLHAYAADLKHHTLVNHLAPLVGHGTLRATVMGFADRPATQGETIEMYRLLQTALQQGAVGLSAGLAHLPGVFSSPAELVEVARALHSFGRTVSVHMRTETDDVLDAISEVVTVGEQAQVPVHISHHKVAGRQNWGRSTETLEMIDDAAQRGIDVTLDVYPYTAGSRGLHGLLPPWANEGGVDAMLARVSDAQQIRRIARECETGLPGWENLVAGTGWERIAIATAPSTPQFEGRAVAAVAAARRITPVEAVAWLLRENAASVRVVMHMMDEADVVRILRHPRAMIGSDGMPLPGKPHPRWAGSFVRVLGRYVRDVAALDFSDAIRRMTSFPADRFGLTGRGRIRPGAVADLVVLDPATVGDRATYDTPLLPPIGVHHVLVGGRFVIEAGEDTGARPGQLLLH